MQKVPDQQRFTQQPSAEPGRRDTPVSADPDTTDSLLAWTKQTGREAHDQEPGAERDRSEALTLLHQAAEAIKARADQSERMEARARTLMARATEEVQRAQARIEELEARLQASEVRANAAEARANAAEVRATTAEARAKVAEGRVQETEEWFQRANEAIATELSAGMRLLGTEETASEEANQNSVAA
jgi:paraquat-inducible protein B